MTIRIIPHGKALYEMSKEFRNEHLRKPLGITLSTEDIEGEEHQYHIAALSAPINDDEVLPDELKILGTAVVHKKSENIANLRQMAVCSSQRGTGLGRKIMNFAESFAKDKGFKSVELCSRMNVQGFYETLGYEVISDEFEHIGMKHVTMRKEL